MERKISVLPWETPEYLKRNKAIARPLAVTVKRVNEVVRGWINYFRVGMMKQFMDEFGQCLDIR